MNDFNIVALVSASPSASLSRIVRHLSAIDCAAWLDGLSSSMAEQSRYNTRRLSLTRGGAEVPARCCASRSASHLIHKTSLMNRVARTMSNSAIFLLSIGGQCSRSAHPLANPVRTPEPLEAATET